jgi:glycosyl transferase family 25
MKIYIVHYDKLVKRKEKMINQLNKFNFDYEFISNYGKEKLTIDDKKKFRNISDGEISVALHHIECFKKIAESNNDYALILEDDAILDTNFNEILNLYISKLTENWDMLFIGDGCNMHIDKNLLIPKKNIYENRSTRCLDSYLISKKCCKIILEKLNLPNYTILCPVDHWLNFVINNNNFNVFWAEPTIVTQGSEKGLFKSSLR